jgi:hypothetical protein
MRWNQGRAEIDRLLADGELQRVPLSADVDPGHVIGRLYGCGFTRRQPRWHLSLSTGSQRWRYGLCPGGQDKRRGLQ